MANPGTIAAVAALVGDPARAAMLHALMDGRALTAGELASVAGIAPPTASGHLGQLSAAGLVVVSRQGRHRYHRLASPQVAGLLESLMLLASEMAPVRPRTGPRDPGLRLARTCYDHIAGRLGVALADALIAQGWIEVEDEIGIVTPEGTRFLAANAIDLAPANDGRRSRAGSLCRLCLDWSERRPHLAGRLGQALCAHGLERDWIRRRLGSRALDVTPKGRRLYREVFRAEDLARISHA